MRRRFSFEFKIMGILLVVLTLVTITGVYAYKRFSEIIINISATTRPDTRLIAAQELVNTLNDAELSAKSFSITTDSVYLQRFYNAVQNIDENLFELRAIAHQDHQNLVQVDSLDSLVSNKLVVLKELILLRDKYRVQQALDNIIDRIHTDTLNTESTPKKQDLLNRLFKRQKLKSPDTLVTDNATVSIDSINNKIERVKNEEIIIENLVKEKELDLIVKDQNINVRISEILDKMKSNERLLIQTEAEAAQLSIDQTNRQIAWFCVATAVLILFMALIIVNYIRNNTKYRLALRTARHEAQDLAKTKELILANMSHEIRTPLNAIIGFTEQISKSSLSYKQHEQISIVNKSANHLLHLINSVLDITKLQADKITLENIAFSPTEVISETMELVQSTHKNTTVKITHEFASNIPAVVIGDSFRLRQILINLMSNSLKFTPNGNVTISLIAEDSLEGMTWLRFKVADTGIGMTKAEMAKAFNEFEQANSSTSRNFGGTGLGLSIVKRLVALQKGKLDIASRRNHGTTITFELPYKIGNQNDLIGKEQEIQFDPSGLLNNISILIVDDEDYNRVLLKTILHKAGSTLVEASNGKQALEALSKTKFDLVLMDVRMPDLSGTEVTDSIRTNPKNLNLKTPIIALTAAITDQDIANYKKVGMNGFLPKPVNERALLTEIMRVLYGKSDLEKIETPSAPRKPLLKDNHAVINLNELQQISGGDAAFYADMLQLFIDGTKKGLIHIRSAYTISDWENVAEQAHKISSPCKHVRANELYTILKEIEKRGRNKENLETIEELINEAETQGDLVCAAIIKELDEMKKN